MKTDYKSTDFWFIILLMTFVGLTNYQISWSINSNTQVVSGQKYSDASNFLCIFHIKLQFF